MSSCTSNGHSKTEEKDKEETPNKNTEEEPQPDVNESLNESNSENVDHGIKREMYLFKRM